MSSGKGLSAQAMTGFTVGTIFKKVIFIVCAGFLSLGTLANPPLASMKQIGLFKNSKTCIVLGTGSITYDMFIKDAVQKYWKSTEFEFIDQPTFEKRRFDPKYSFLVLMKAVYDKDPGGVSYNYISLVLGNATLNLSKMPELCSIPLSYTDDNIPDYEYVIPAIVKFMQKHVVNLEEDRFIISLKGLKYYNSATGYKDKVLLFNKEMMAANADSPEKIKTAYPYYVKLITAEEIRQELLSNPTNALFHFHVGPNKNTAAGKCFEMIFDIDGNLYYYNSRKITNDNEDGFNLNDFNHLR
jgi:hypothetical protein